MNHLPRCDQPSATTAPLSAPAKAETLPMPDAGVLRLRAVHRATADLRRGTPVVLVGPTTLVIIPAETAGARGLGELAALAKSPAILLLAASRATALLAPSALPMSLRPADATAQAFHLPAALLTPETLRSLADPSSDQLLPQPPMPADVPGSAAAALALVKLARLLPAAVVADPRIDAACRPVARLARDHYRAADAVMAKKPAGRLAAPRLMSAVYGAILGKMETAGWAPPRARAKVGKGALLWIVLSRGLLG